MDPRTDLVTLVIELPGTSAILRAAGINFRAGGDRTLATAAAAHGIPLGPLMAKLRAHESLLSAADSDPAARAALIGLLLTEGARLASGLEARFSHHAGCPNGLAGMMRNFSDLFARHDAAERAASGRPDPALKARLVAEHQTLKEQLDAVAKWWMRPAALAGLGATGRALGGILRALDHDLRRRLEIEDRALADA